MGTLVRSLGYTGGVTGVHWWGIAVTVFTTVASLSPSPSPSPAKAHTSD